MWPPPCTGNLKGPYQGSGRDRSWTYNRMLASIPSFPIWLEGAAVRLLILPPFCLPTPESRPLRTQGKQSGVCCSSQASIYLPLLAPVNSETGFCASIFYHMMMHLCQQWGHAKDTHNTRGTRRRKRSRILKEVSIKPLFPPHRDPPLVPCLLPPLPPVGGDYPCCHKTLCILS